MWKLIRKSNERETYVCKHIRSKNADIAFHEFRIARYLAHPAVLKVYEVYPTNADTPIPLDPSLFVNGLSWEHGKEGMCVVMEDLGSWQDRRAYLETNKWGSQRFARSIMQQLVRVVAFIHSKGYAHNDIKGTRLLT
jgi:serine/threonine protein kinase